MSDQVTEADQDLLMAAAGVSLPAPVESEENTAFDEAADWQNYPIEGYARAAQERGMSGYFKCPLISHIDNNLWSGGCSQNVILPPEIRYVVSLYPWEQYDLKFGAQRIEVTMYDAAEMPDEGLIWSLADLVNDLCKHGQTLVHCQAGLNRSGLISGLALVAKGYEPEKAIKLLREKRSPMVLCNQTFENWLLEQV